MVGGHVERGIGDTSPTTRVGVTRSAQRSTRSAPAGTVADGYSATLLSR